LNIRTEGRKEHRENKERNINNKYLEGNELTALSGEEKNL
jgi:hypothetical protein